MGVASSASSSSDATVKPSRPDVPSSPETAPQSYGIASDSDDDSTTTTVTPVRQTPLPKLQLSIVLCLKLAEPIAATVIYPFITQLVSEIGITNGDPKAVGYYVGLIESLFFVAEGLCVLQWGRLSDRIGRRPVALMGLVGVGLSITSFGLSKTFAALVASRALSGLLNGNIGVMKSMLGELTDDTNQAYVLGITPIVWSTGVSLGPLMGGFLEHPAQKYPSIFGGWSFWITYPYFLPCAVAGFLCLLGVFVGFFWLEETLPTKLRKRSPSPPNQTTPLLASQVDDHVVPSVPPTDINDDAPIPPLRSLLTRSVLVVIANYGSLAILDIAHFSLLPLFYASPPSAGGLGLSPNAIGTIMAIYGIFCGTFQVMYFAKIHAVLGAKRIWLWGISAFVIVFGCYPVMHQMVLANGGKIGWAVWAVMGLQLVSACMTDMVYSCVFIFTNAAASSPRTLGATNGIGQTVISFVRALGPAGSTALFALSVEKRLLNGYFVYGILGFATLGAMWCSTLLPRSERRFQGDYGK